MPFANATVTKIEWMRMVSVKGPQPTIHLPKPTLTETEDLFKSLGSFKIEQKKNWGSFLFPRLSKTRMCRLNLGIVLTILGLMLGIDIGESMRFELDSGNTKCISEDIKTNAMTVGKYSIVNPNEGYPLPDSHKLAVRVTSPYGNNYHLGDHVDSGTFAFTAAESGDYTACFWATNHKSPARITIDFDWKSGVAAKDWSKVAKKGQVETMEVELKKLYDTVTSIHEEMFYLREREEEMQQLNKETNSKMATLSLFSLVVCLSVAGLQIWHLKAFFERKKLL